MGLDCLRETVAVQPRARWTALWIATFATALALRSISLDRRPMHADEAVQAAIARQLWWKGEYRYNPDEFHGPTLPYATAASLAVERPRDFAATTASTYRRVPVLFGSAMVLVVALLASGLGRRGAWWAALLMAVSPAAVYYSRYDIHETLLAAATLAALAAAWRYWQSGRIAWCLAAGFSLGLMQATKETAVLTYFAWAAGTALTLAWGKWLARRERASTLPPAGEESGVRADDPARRLTIGAVVALTTAALVALAFYSSFFSNARGPLDAMLTYLPWIHRAGGESPHVQPWYYYLQILGWHRAEGGPLWSEGAVIVLAAVGFAASLRRGAATTDANPGLVRFIGFSTLVLTAVYSVIPYKTPWCLIQFHTGMLLLAGVGAAALLNRRRRAWFRTMAAGALLLVVAHLGWQTWQSSFVMPADPRNPYVYVHTLPDAERLARDVEELALASADRLSVPVEVIWSDAYYWPLPWYLRRLDRVGLWTRLPPGPSAPIVIASPRFDAELTARLDATHLMTGYYGLRPGVLAQLWVRMDLWEAHLRRLGRIE
jgi:uncharacterized protein (TIGR03663 family)